MNDASVSDDELERYQYLWDGTENWVLSRLLVSWYALRLQFEEAGPTKAEIFALRKLLSDFRDKSWQEVTTELTGIPYYEIPFRSFDRMQELDKRAKQLNLKTSQHNHRVVSYLPMSSDEKSGLLIEDDALNDAIIKKMLDAGVPVIDHGEFKG